MTRQPAMPFAECPHDHVEERPDAVRDDILHCLQCWATKRDYGWAHKEYGDWEEWTDQEPPWYIGQCSEPLICDWHRRMAAL